MAKIAATGEIVYPVHFLDSSQAVASIVLAWTLRYDDVLDAEKLHSSLWQLLEIGDWRKLGGRLRRSPKTKKLEVHVPTTYSKERPPVAYSRETYNLKIDEHSLARQLPSGADISSVQRGPPDFRSFAVPPGAPKTLQEYLEGDLPQLGLHIVSFEDATLVSISWPHVATDGSGFRDLLRAWSMVLAGRADEVPPILGADEDIPFKAAAYDPDKLQRSPLKKRALQGYHFIIFAILLFWDIFRSRIIQNKSICLTKDALQRLHQRAMLDISNETFFDGSKAWVSESDALIAWMCQLIAKSYHNPRPIVAGSVIDLRTKIPALAERRDEGVFVQNILANSGTPLSYDLLTGPLGKAALANRRELNYIAQPDMLLEQLQLGRELAERGKDPRIHFAKPFSRLVMTTDRSKANIISSGDFGPAVVRRGKGDHASGMASYQHSTLLKTPIVWRNFLSFNGKDPKGNFWITAYLRPQTWAIVEEEISKI